jgi:hypothetical protein
MGKYKYLAEIIAMICIEYIVLICCFIALKSKNVSFASGSFFDKNLETSGRSWLGKRYPNYSKHANVGLLVFRLVAFGWLGILGMITHFALYPYGWHYYTNWNIILISFYFLMASITSILQVTPYGQSTTPTPSSSATTSGMIVRAKAMARLGQTSGACFGFVASSALMVTVLNYMLLSANGKFWNTVLHGTQTILITMEMCVNDIQINRQEVVLAVSWPMLYVVFIWPVVAEGVKEWPYFFVEVGRSSAFVWYHILFLLSIIFFLLTLGIDYIKWKYVVGIEQAPITVTSIAPVEQQPQDIEIPNLIHSPAKP